MKTFACIARDKNGALIKSVRPSTDRNALLKELQAEGLVPVSVCETSFPLSGKGHASRGWLFVASAALALLLVVGMVFWLLCERGNENPLLSQEIASVQRATTGQVQKMKYQTNAAARTIPPVAAAKPAPQTDDPVKTVSIIKPVVGSYTNRVTPQETSQTTVPQPLQPEIRRPFSSGTDNIIAMLANVRPGYPPPPLMNLPLGEDVKKMLERDIVLYDDDAENVVKSKENTARMKQSLRKYLTEGGAPETFMAYYHEALTQDYNKWKSAQQKVFEFIQAGDKEGAIKYVQEKNAELEEQGLRSIVVPKNLLEQ